MKTTPAEDKTIRNAGRSWSEHRATQDNRAQVTPVVSMDDLTEQAYADYDDSCDAAEAIVSFRSCE